MSVEKMMLTNHLILCYLLLLLPSIFPSIRVFSSELALCIRRPKVLELQHQSSNEYSGLISFRIDWFDLLAIQGTLKNFFQDHNLKASILWCSDFFMVQLSHLYMTAGKTIALSIWTFVSKVMSLLFNILSRFIIALYMYISIDLQKICQNLLKMLKEHLNSYQGSTGEVISLYPQ